MELHQVFDKIQEQLPQVKHKTIKYIYYFLHTSISFCLDNNLTPSTKNIVNSLARVLVIEHGLLAEIVCLQYHLLSYKIFGEVLDKLVLLREFTYNEDDSLQDFDNSSDLLLDIKKEISNYNLILTAKLNDKNLSNSN